MESKLKNKRGELATEKEHQKKSSSGCLAGLRVRVKSWV